MSLSRLGAASPEATLPVLPQDVLFQILDRMPPAQIATYAQLNKAAFEAASHPSVWASAARRHLAVAPEHPVTSAALLELAQTLVCRWWLLMGTVVAGVPAHFRRGFSDVCTRGGLELPIVSNESDTCYVFGPQYRHRIVPALTPGVTLHFFFDAAGPFPVQGMRLRIIHAVRQPRFDDERTDDLPRGMAHLSLSAPRYESVYTEPGEARVAIRVNSDTLFESFTPQGENFSVLDIDVSPDCLVTKPRMNTICIEYDRTSTAAYWLRDVSIVPSIIPPQHVDEEWLKFPQRNTPPFAMYPETSSRSFAPYVTDAQETREENNNREAHEAREESDRAGSSTPTSPRLPGVVLKHVVADEQASARARKGKGHTQSKRPKHVYHHNYYRSPRRSVPSSPKGRFGR